RGPAPLSPSPPSSVDVDDRGNPHAWYRLRREKIQLQRCAVRMAVVDIECFQHISRSTRFYPEQRAARAQVSLTPAPSRSVDPGAGSKLAKRWCNSAPFEVFVDIILLDMVHHGGIS